MADFKRSRIEGTGDSSVSFLDDSNSVRSVCRGDVTFEMVKLVGEDRRACLRFRSYWNIAILGLLVGFLGGQKLLSSSTLWGASSCE